MDKDDIPSELHDLKSKIDRSQNVLVVMTPLYLHSMYCRMEVEAAAEFKRNVVIALKEGSNWEDACPSEGLEKLQPEARPIFNKAKCIKHYTVGQHLQEFRREVLT